MSNYDAYARNTHTLDLVTHKPEPRQKLAFFLFVSRSLGGKLFGPPAFNSSRAFGHGPDLLVPFAVQPQDVGLTLCPGLCGTVQRNVRQVCLPQLQTFSAFLGPDLKV